MLYKLREMYDIAIVACIPFAGQEEKFSPRQKEVYKNYVEASDGKVVLYPRYQTGCYFDRNRYMGGHGRSADRLPARRERQACFIP